MQTKRVFMNAMSGLAPTVLCPVWIPFVCVICFVVETSSADLGHAAGGRDEVLGKTVAPGFFMHSLADAVGEGVVAFAAAQQIEQIDLVVAEQAEAQHAVGGQTHAVAGGAGHHEVADVVAAATRDRVDVVERRRLERELLRAVDAAFQAVAQRGALERDAVVRLFELAPDGRRDALHQPIWPALGRWPQPTVLLAGHGPLPNPCDRPRRRAHAAVVSQAALDGMLTRSPNPLELR